MILDNESLIISQEMAKENITTKEILDIEEQTYKWYSEGLIEMPAKITLNMDKLGLPNWINSMPSYIKPLDMLGIKWAGGFENNKGKGLPYIMAQILINNPDTGELRALLDGNWITDIRTGAQSAVAAKFLASATDILTIIGAGIQGINTAICMLEQFDIKKINVIDLDESAINNFKNIIKEKYSIKIESLDSKEQAIRESDVIVTVTTADKPLVEENWVKPGALVSTAGSYQELSEDLIFKADKLFVDHMEQNIHRGEFSHYFEEGKLAVDDIAGEIGDVINNKVKGRENSKERIIISPIGMGCLDIAIATNIYNKLKESKSIKNQKFNILN